MIPSQKGNQNEKEEKENIHTQNIDRMIDQTKETLNFG